MSCDLPQGRGISGSTDVVLEIIEDLGLSRGKRFHNISSAERLVIRDKL
jgi:hypothetical protein